MSETHVKELQQARARVESGAAYYICDALRLEKEWTVRPWSETALEAVKQIRIDIGGRFDLGQWLKEVHKVDVPYGCKARYEFLRATRLAWIDALIEYWKDRP